MAIATVEFDLSMIDQDTGRYMTARAYTVDGITNADGSLREMSIGQLVMAICLDRASKLEAGIIDLMEEMNNTSALLEAMTELESAVVTYYSGSPAEHTYDLRYRTITKGQYAGRTYQDFLAQDIAIIPQNPPVNWIRDDGVYSNADVLYTDFITNIEAKMDENNSFSQQKMIELQSQTSKRDQTYDMISNILKSLNTVLVGNANNL